MLTATFVHAQGIGFATERALWRQGATSWSAYRDIGHGLPLSKRTRDTISRKVDESVAAHDDANVTYFARELPLREHWRAVSSFRRLGFLDIETDGGVGADSVTVIGLSDGYDCTTYIKGRNLNDFVADCAEYGGFVTFFGGGFDIPMLKRRFPILDRVFRDRLHIDLCPALRRLDLRGGLKSIEHQLGISRVPEAEGLDGMDAVRLWSAYQSGRSGSDDALRTLIAYNREDVVNMKTLLDYALPRLTELSGFDEECAVAAEIVREASFAGTIPALQA